jgi:hypothetical protein
MVNLPKVLLTVTPAQAGVQDLMGALDSSFLRNDGKARFSNFCESSVTTIVLFLRDSNQETVEAACQLRLERSNILPLSGALRV